MPKAKSQSEAGAVAWWLGPGDHECPHCGQLYFYELEFRCPDCDEPSCAHCRQRNAQGRDVCFECVTVTEITIIEGSSHG